MAVGDEVIVEVELVGEGNNLIKVRIRGNNTWDEIGPKDYHPESGYDFQEMRALGEGSHTLKQKPLK